MDAITPMVRNILRVYRSATPEQHDIGVNWYADALGIVTDFAQVHGTSVDVSAGVFAALSPQNGYGANVNLARRFMASGGTLTSGYLGMGLTKARAIHAGAEIEPTLSGLKTINFYRSIVTGGIDGVTIDRHAYCLAIGERLPNAPKLSPKRYAEVAEAYTRAAARVGLTPAQIQAVTWVVWRARFWSAGAFDPKA